MRRKIPIVFLLMFFLVLTVVVAQTTSMNNDERSAAADLLQATNQDRSSHGLEPLHSNPELTKAAWEHARRMVASGTLSH
ncbi:MAG TPA: CAP domain-containing protein, partial [Acidobacteriaceae bacterium]|nr:CAP domain-containing protein [Acidobacteriaceae bacterium]